MYRLFIAIDIPDDARRAAAGICRGVAAARWLPEAQLHLTLRFLGDVDDDLFDTVKSALGLIDFPTFELSFRGTGCFPGPRRPRVLWVGMERSTPLLALQRRIEEAVVAAGFPAEDRPFSPHLTLARLKEPVVHDVERFLRENASFSIPAFTVGEFHLYSSRLSPRGAIHTREKSYPLTGSGGPSGGE